MNHTLTPEQQAFDLLEKILETQPHLLDNSGRGQNSCVIDGNLAGKTITELHAHLLAHLKQRQPS